MGYPMLNFLHLKYTTIMAENKKSFIAYTDWQDIFNALPDEVAGKLIKFIFAYVNDENPETDDVLLNAVFASIKATLKRDLKKWEKQQEQRILAGQRSAELRKLKSTLVERPLTKNNKRTISSTVSVSVSDSEYIYTEKLFLQRWKDARMHFDKKPTNIKKLSFHEKQKFNELLKLGYSEKDFDKAISGLFKNDTYQSVRLRPNHFLELENFEKYLTAFEGNVVLFPKSNKIKSDEL